MDLVRIVLKYILPLLLLHKCLNDCRTIQLLRSDGNSTSTIFLHLNFTGRMVIDYANPNHVIPDPILCWFCSVDEGVYTSII
jgi:hypothetical protein